MESQFFRNFFFQSPPRSRGKEPPTRANKQLDDLKDAVEGTEVGCRLGDDFFKFSLKDLDGKTVIVPIRDSVTKRQLIERLAEAQEELERLEAALERKKPARKDGLARFTADRCTDFGISPALLRYFPPPRP